MAAECLVRDAWQDATSILYKKLDNISIASLIQKSDKNHQERAACISS
jgi:DNA-binding IscR family transcriptional regulator